MAGLDQFIERQRRLRAEAKELARRVARDAAPAAVYEVPAPEREELLDRSLFTLEVSLEELQVAEAELRQQNEELLHARERIDAERARYEELFEFAPDGYVVTDIYGNVRQANRAAVELLGVSASTLAGKPLVVFVAESDRTEFRARVAGLADVSASDEWLVQLAPRSGEATTVAVRLAPVRQGDSIAGIRWLLRDASDRVRAEQEIRALNHDLERRVAERTRQLEAANALKGELLRREREARREAERAQRRMMFLAAASSVLAESHHRAQALHVTARLAASELADWCVAVDVDDAGVPGEVAVAHENPEMDSLAHELRQLYDAERRLPFGLVRALRSGRSELVPDVSAWRAADAGREQAELRRLDELGVRSYMVVPFVTRGRVLGALAFFSAEKGVRYGPEELRVAEDLASRAAMALENSRLFAAREQARQAAERASDAKSRFLAVITHELRTPLTAIGGYTELLELGLHGPLNGLQQEDVRRIHAGYTHLLGIVEGVLDFAKLERGQVALMLTDVAVTDLCASLDPLVAPQVVAKRLRYECTGAGAEVTTRADAGKLRQILLNLLSNAVKFTPADGEVSVTWEALSDKVVFQVRDTGIGIPEEHQQAVFEPFVQLGQRTSDRSLGAGLGLAISRSFATAMGGDLRLRSAPGIGSVFTLSVPRGPDRPATELRD